jgi:hypothetical protein
MFALLGDAEADPNAQAAHALRRASRLRSKRNNPGAFKSKFPEASETLALLFARQIVPDASG